MSDHRRDRCLVVMGLLVGCRLALCQPAVEPTFDQQIDKLVKARQFGVAADQCVKRLQANPADAEAKAALELTFEQGVMLGGAQALQATFRSWTEAQPDRAEPHVWLGAVLAAQADREADAEKSLRRAVELDPRSAEARFRLAALLDWQWKEEEAQAEWRRFLELEPNTDRAWLVRRGVALIGATNVTNTPGVPEIEPAWSPDGKHLAFLQGWNWDLYRLNLDTGERKALTQGDRYEARIDWSPDGRRLLLTKIANPKLLYTLPADGSQAPQPLGAQAAAYMASWSADGKEVYFSTQRGIWIVGGDGQNQRPVPNLQDRGVFHTWPSPAPDGKRVVCAALIGRGRRDVCLFPLDNPAAHVHLTTSEAEHHVPSVSPDGRHVAFSAKWKAWFDAGICAVDEPGREVPILPCFFESQWGPGPRWSPDGRFLAITRPRFGDLWIAQLGGLENRPVHLSAKPQGGGLVVSLRSLRQRPQTATLAFRLYDAQPVLLAEGAVGEANMALAPGAAIECPLPLADAKALGAYTVKLTAVTDKGERVVGLVDYGVKG